LEGKGDISGEVNLKEKFLTQDEFEKSSEKFSDPPKPPPSKTLGLAGAISA